MAFRKHVLHILNRSISIIVTWKNTFKGKKLFAKCTCLPNHIANFPLTTTSLDTSLSTSLTYFPKCFPNYFPKGLPMIESLTSSFGASLIVSPSLKDFLAYFSKALPQLPLQMSQNKKCENALDKISTSTSSEMKVSWFFYSWISS